MIDKHVTTSVAVLYPRLSQRVRRALPYIQKFKLKSSIEMLLDKYGNEPGAEIEFGGDFPIESIKEIIIKKY